MGFLLQVAATAVVYMMQPRPELNIDNTAALLDNVVEPWNPLRPSPKPKCYEKLIKVNLACC